MSDTTTTEATEVLPVHPAVEQLQKTLGEIELDVMTSYTLADAIREGATVTGQKVGGWIDESTSCGLGAAYLAAQARGFVPK